MTDRELLERAAKAAGHGIQFSTDGRAFISGLPGIGWKEWHPLEDDGDALRLAVRLNISPSQIAGSVVCGVERISPSEDRLIQEWPDNHKGDLYAATRRAIVRAAAAMSEGPC